MSGFFVRPSKFRHVFGRSFKKDKCYNEIEFTRDRTGGTHDGGMFSSVNGKFMAVAVSADGGGAFLVAPLEKVGVCNPALVKRLLPVRTSMRFVYVSVYMCACRQKKHACLRLTVRNSPQKRTSLPVY